MDKISRDWIPLNKDLCGTRVLDLNVLWRQAGNCRTIVSAIGKIYCKIYFSYNMLFLILFTGDSVYLTRINNRDLTLIAFIEMANVKPQKTIYFVLRLRSERPCCITFTNLSCRKEAILLRTVT